jgi:L-ascorbate metabolism protein UlaG (beta-lactamase superfamily)
MAMRTLLPFLFVLMFAAVSARAAEPFEKDIFKTSGGDLEITFVGHGTLIFTYGGKVIHVDPWSKLADYGTLPKADAILITHTHTDHLDPAAIEKIRTGTTVVIVTPLASEKLAGGVVMRNGDSRTVFGIPLEAVPAYNLLHKRDNGLPYHPRGEGNGYVLTFGGTRVYVAGDTENIPEMKALANIDIAFLPMNLPYTMTAEMVADAARAFRPKVLYPYHFAETDTSRLAPLLKDAPGIEVRIRRMP